MPVLVRSRLRRTRILMPSLERLTQRILRLTGHPAATVSIECIGDRRMRALNSQYRRIDATTDVLAFALREAPGPSTSLLGDVVISIPQAIRQAYQQAHSPSQEVAALLVHGLLHLLGYDHERSAAEARRMHTKEAAILARLQPVPALLHLAQARRNIDAGRRKSEGFHGMV
ncbi:rRNA maturation RNase YbeY [Candidatus Nitrospira bockiana]